MSTNWAAENLHAIRTIMERSAIYRRALAPVMTFTGSVGILAAIVGPVLNITGQGFVIYWMAVSGLVIGGNYFLERKQALKDREPFWSPPTRRVTQALLPALFVGLITCILGIVWTSDFAIWLPTIWMFLYGCALHAAGFFMPRGIKLFAWAFILGACTLLLIILMSNYSFPAFDHIAMGCSFGGAHLAYGVYLYFTEQRKNEP